MCIYRQFHRPEVPSKQLELLGRWPELHVVIPHKCSITGK